MTLALYLTIYNTEGRGSLLLGLMKRFRYSHSRLAKRKVFL